MEISEEEKQILEQAYKKEKNAKVKIRILTILYLYVDKMTMEATSKLLRISLGSVQEYKDKYEQGKLPELRIINCSIGRPSNLTEAQKEELKTVVANGHFLTSQSVCEYAENQYGITYTANAMTKLLKKLGFVHKKPKTVPGKADPAKQEEFLKTILKPILEAANDVNPVYFEDAVHMQHNSQAAYGWILKGSNKELKQNSGRQRININGAVCFHNQEVVSREDQTINTGSTIALLTQVRVRHPIDISIKMVLDNARYNHAKEVVDFAEKNNIELVFLPPYSPNLNLIERLWGHLKKSVTHNQYYENFSEFHAAVLTFFETIPKQKEALAKLLSPNFTIIGRSTYNSC